jgi:hypothetical protein
MFASVSSVVTAQRPDVGITHVKLRMTVHNDCAISNFNSSDGAGKAALAAALLARDLRGGATMTSIPTISQNGIDYSSILVNLPAKCISIGFVGRGYESLMNTFPCLKTPKDEMPIADADGDVSLRPPVRHQATTNYASRSAAILFWTPFSFSALVSLETLYFKLSFFHSSLLFFGSSSSGFLNGSSRMAAWASV